MEPPSAAISQWIHCHGCDFSSYKLGSFFGCSVAWYQPVLIALIRLILNTKYLSEMHLVAATISAI